MPRICVLIMCQSFLVQFVHGDDNSTTSGSYCDAAARNDPTLDKIPNRQYLPIHINIEDAKSYVSIRKQGRHVCSGVLTTYNTVLTDAGCVCQGVKKNTIKRLSIHSGTNYIYCPGIVSTVKDLICRPTRSDNIAILKLTHNLTYTSAKQWSSLPVLPASPKIYKFIGWRNYAHGRQGSLQSVPITVFSKLECQRMYPHTTERIICAGSKKVPTEMIEDLLTDNGGFIGDVDGIKGILFGSTNYNSQTIFLFEDIYELKNDITSAYSKLS